MSSQRSVLLVTGVNHHTLSAEGREQFARVYEDPEKLYQALEGELGIRECVVISTCNRFELVVADTVNSTEKVEEHLDRLIERIQSFLSQNIESPVGGDVWFEKRGQEAVRYVFRVAASLESMVLGETQILGQIKDAYRTSVSHGMCGKIVHRLFQSAFQLAKKVRVHTKIADKPVSISYIAVKLVEQIFGGVSSCRTLLLGSGHMAELAALHLVNYGCNELVIANRTIEKAEVLAERFQGAAIGLDEIDRYLGSVDVVIGSLSIDRPLIELSKIQSLDRNRPLFFIDLGMPRNFPPALGEIDNVYLYDIDDFSAIVDDHKQIREKAAQDAGIVVEFAVHQFLMWIGRVHHEPTLLDLRSRIELMCSHELEQLVLEAGEERSDVIRRISRKISHEVTHLFQEKVSRPRSKQDVLEDYLDVVMPYGRIGNE